MRTTPITRDAPVFLATRAKTWSCQSPFSWSSTISVRKLLGTDSWTTFIADVTEGVYRLENKDQQLLERAAELERIYASLPLGLVDAAVIATCERLGETKAATLDRRHFSVVRPAHCEALTLLPE